MKPTLQATTQETFAINLTNQALETSQMEGITATIFNRLSTLQPQRLDSMKSEGILESFLNHHTEAYHNRMALRFQNLTQVEKMTLHSQIQTEVLRETLSNAQIV